MKFRDKYGFLSNMSDSPIALKYKGNVYRFRSVEAAYQSCKCMDRMGEFQQLSGPQAKRLGHQVPLRPDWDERKLDIMRQLVDMKFRQNPGLRQALLATGDEPIVEENDWGDTYFGTVNGVGENHLGKILMNARETFRLEAQKSAPEKTASTATAAGTKTLPATQAADAKAPGLSLCFTGQRPKDLMPDSKKAYYMASYAKFRKDLALYLDGMYAAGYRTFISGGAQGFDQIAFWAVDDLKAVHPDIRNVVYLPFKGQERKWLPYGDFGPNDYKRMVEKADNVVWTSEVQGIQVDLETGRNISRAMDQRNHAMVDDADIVIALYKDPNGVDPAKRGSGTNNCMLYARNTGVPVYQIVYDNDAAGMIAPRRAINIIAPVAERAPRKTPMWAAGKDYDGAVAVQRDTSDLDTACGNITSSQPGAETPYYDIDI